MCIRNHMHEWKIDIQSWNSITEKPCTPIFIPSSAREKAPNEKHSWWPEPWVWRTWEKWPLLFRELSTIVFLFYQLKSSCLAIFFAGTVTARHRSDRGTITLSRSQWRRHTLIEVVSRYCISWKSVSIIWNKCHVLPTVLPLFLIKTDC